MRTLLNILSVLGLDRWAAVFSSQLQDVIIEGVSALEARAELVQQEWHEEQIRLKRLILCAILCFAFLLVLLFSLSVAVIVTFWSSEYRILSVWLVVAFWALCSLFCFVRILFIAQKGKYSFQYSKRELREDWETIKDQLSE